MRYFKKPISFLDEPNILLGVKLLEDETEVALTPREYHWTSNWNGNFNIKDGFVYIPLAKQDGGGIMDEDTIMALTNDGADIISIQDMQQELHTDEEMVTGL
jgi:hypothetical protein